MNRGDRHLKTIRYFFWCKVSIADEPVDFLAYLVSKRTRIRRDHAYLASHFVNGRHASTDVPCYCSSTFTRAQSLLDFSPFFAGEITAAG